MQKLLALLALAIGAAFLAPVSSGPADAYQASAGDSEAQFIAQLNAARAAVGVAPLTVHRELTDLSRGWAQSMADAGQISHASPISAGLSAPWLKLGENVGTGGDVQSVMNAFIASPGHYANIIDPEFTHVGVAVVWDGLQLYTTHRFMLMQETPPAPAPVPVAAPTTASASVPTTTSPPQTSSTTPASSVPLTAPLGGDSGFPHPQADVNRVATVLEALRSLEA